MLTLIERIRERLAQGAYTNEAAVSQGIVIPVLTALGWDTADPHQVKPEYALPGARVDYALCGFASRPSVFIEVKQVGRAVEGDRQLFEYAFHKGVPLCVLTDGREWSFYLPSGQGSYEERRVYRLQLDDRSPAECEQILRRYLAHDRVRDGSAYEDAQRDYRDRANQRDATATLPRAWEELVASSHELLIETLSDKVEALSGYQPAVADVEAFLRSLQLSRSPAAAANAPVGVAASAQIEPEVAPRYTVSFTLFGQVRQFETARDALVDLLTTLAARDPARLPALAEKLRFRKRNLVARTPAEINPERPDLARGAEIAPGWLVGLNISNREKMVVVRAAAEVFGVSIPADLEFTLPNG